MRALGGYAPWPLGPTAFGGGAANIKSGTVAQNHTRSHQVRRANEPDDSQLPSSTTGVVKTTVYR